MKTKNLIIILSIFIAVVHSAPNDEVAAGIFLKDASDKMYALTDKMVDLAYDTITFESTNQTSSEEASDESSMVNAIFLFLYKAGKMSEITEQVVKYSEEAGNFNYNEFKNPEIKNALQHFHYIAGPLVVENEHDAATEAIDSIQESKNICSFKKETKCDLGFNEDVNEKIRESNDPAEIKHYWKEWRSKNQNLFKTALQTNIELIKKTAEHYKISPSMAWFIDYYDENFIDEMEKVVKEIQPFYKELHAYIRSVLIKKFGKDIIQEPGVITADLFEKVLADAWNREGILSNLVVDNNVLNLKKIWKEHGVTARKIVEYSDGFFKSMGFEELPKSFWDTRVKELEDIEQDEVDCRAIVFDISPKPYLKYCPDVNMKKFLQMHGWMARIHYAVNKKDLPYSFFESYNFEYPVGEAAILSAFSAKHMNSLNLIKNTNYADDNIDMARLLHLAVHTVLNIPIYYIHARVMNDLVSDKVKLEDLNQHYWDLMLEYAGVVSPYPVEKTEITLPYNFYNALNDNNPTTKFISEVIGYQIYESLCKKNDDTTELHKCDFSGNAEAGKVLKEMMVTGSKKSWREVLSIVTGTTTGMSGQPILNYYSPLNKYISNINKNEGTNIGWPAKDE